MGDMFGRVGHYLAQPQDIIYSVASALLYPVLFFEVLALLYVAFHTGVLTVEAISRRRARRLLDVEGAAGELAEAGATSDPKKAADALRHFDYGPVVGPAARSLIAQGLSRIRTLKILGDAERTAIRRLDKTRIFIRLGPILGLMGTLIPISPALVALAKGDTETLSANLVVAFSTTVVGLLIGAIGYLTALARERMYAQDLADLEYVLEHVGARR
ncbi:MAG: MotA/TolQ/ExbB proton channel family protein [Coriobacteriia bacterium]|nr:MotA/TolQ/ExbB proton channel family protein [Coriobacteriia bacterium]